MLIFSCLGKQINLQEFEIVKSLCEKEDWTLGFIDDLENFTNENGSFTRLQFAFDYIPFEVGNCSIPDNIGNLSNLEYLYLSGYVLESSISSSIGDLQKLSYLQLSESLISGSIPSELGKLTNLETLSLFHNLFVLN